MSQTKTGQVAGISTMDARGVGHLREMTSEVMNDEG